jgi:hypothetical protein
VHPRDSEGFEWDEANESELAAHQIRPWEVEEVFLNSPRWSRNKAARSADWKMVGRTDAGRPLTIVVSMNQRTLWLRPVTGWKPTADEEAKYLSK